MQVLGGEDKAVKAQAMADAEAQAGGPLDRKAKKVQLGLTTVLTQQVQCNPMQLAARRKSKTR